MVFLSLVSTPAVYIITHLGLNALFGALNGFGVIKNDIGGKIVNVIHALISLLVMINLYKNPLIYGGSKEITKETGLFWLLIPHLVVNIIYIVLVCVISDEEANKIIKIIYSCVSSLVLIVIGIFIKKLKEKVTGTTETPAETPGEESGENQVEAAAAGKDPGTAATGLNNASGLKKKEVDPEKKEFGKRQRRRNPPKRRKKKY
tara:strand:- start:549 stop:1160 length:612 start_codon:yes stop_codon:yes gene_type:complete